MKLQSPVSHAIDRSHERTFPILTPVLRRTWILFVSATILLQLVQMPDMSRPVLYCVWALKLLGFGLVGFVAPLAFERFNAFIRGLLLGIITATAVEVLQALLGHGHGFHVEELLIKLLFIFVGFCIGIVVRYERAITAGPICIRLITL